MKTELHELNSIKAMCIILLSWLLNVKSPDKRMLLIKVKYYPQTL